MFIPPCRCYQTGTPIGSPFSYQDTDTYTNTLAFALRMNYLILQRYVAALLTSVGNLCQQNFANLFPSLQRQSDWHGLNKDEEGTMRFGSPVLEQWFDTFE